MGCDLCPRDEISPLLAVGENVQSGGAIDQQSCCPEGQDAEVTERFSAKEAGLIGIS